MKKYIAFAAVAVLFPALSLAASMSAGQRVSFEGTTVAQGNAYMAGGTVMASGVVNGDLLAAGGTIVSSAKVNGDIMAVGGTITMVGVSAQDVRIAGGNVTVGGTMTGELTTVAGTLVVTPGTTIAKDSYLAGGSISFSGNEAGNLKIAGGDIYFNGITNGNVTIAKATRVTVGPNAVIKGTFEYSAPVAAAIDGGAKITGTPVFHEVQVQKQNTNWFTGTFGSILTIWWLLKLLMALVAAYLVWYLFRNDSLAVLDQSRSHYGKSLLRGFIFLVAMPIAAIIAFVTIIGVIPGVIALLSYFLLLTLAAPFAVLFAAALLRKGKTDLRWYHLLLGAVVFAIVGLIPFIGWIACALVYLAALGAVANVLKEKIARR